MKLKIFVLYMAIVAGSGLLFVNFYNSIVDAPNWGHYLPQSLDVARKYFDYKTPAELFKFTGPLVHVIGINCVFRFLKTDKKVLRYNIIALALILIVDLLTYVFFFPLNEVLFGTTQDTALIQQALQEWKQLNWCRTILLAVIPIMYSLSLNRYLKVVWKIDNEKSEVK